MSRFALCPIFLLSLSVSGFGHQLPDDEIERRVQISVKPDRVLVEYSIAMNEVTLKDQLEKEGLKPAATLPEMWKQYQEIVLESLPKKLQLTVDGRIVRFEPVQATYRGWSHRHLECLFKADVQLERERSEIVVTDGNFANSQGKYRIAMKGRSGAKIENANVPLLVSRAKPVELAKLKKQQKQDVAKAQGEVVLEQL